MEKCRSPLLNMDYGFFAKKCNHEASAEIGWLLYSTRQQDEGRLSDLVSDL
jgi:hypothetical protein